MIRIALFMVLFLCPGCMFLEDRADNGNASRSRISRDGWAQKPVNAPPAPLESATRVDTVGRRLLAANPQLGIRPLFNAIGTDQETVFHQGSNAIYISDGLVKACKTEDELAAVLSIELGKMVAEREAESPTADKERRDLEPPFAPNLTPDVAGAGGSMAPDLTRQAELAKFERDKPRAFTKKSGRRILPDPLDLAEGYLNKAGFDPRSVEHVDRLLQKASRNPDFERQMSRETISGLAIQQEESPRKSETDR